MATYTADSECAAIVRRAKAEDAPRIAALVYAVVAVTYGRLFDSAPPAPDLTRNWIDWWIAEVEHEFAGVGSAKKGRIDDLWIDAAYRGRGVGSALLATMERQIAEDGYATASLRVVSENVKALRFYQRRGWTAVRSYPHERWSFEMTDMSKEVGMAG